jgi:spore germination cell wall hydrolase CwlJ-like protein
MLFKLRLLWYRADKAALVFGLFCSLVVGALAVAFSGVTAHREARQEAVREFHGRSLDCLARNVYYEARGESRAGQYAVAEVTMNRKASPLFPNTVCEVVYQKEAFSWTSFEGLEPPAGEAWRRAMTVAAEVYYQRRPPTLHGVTHFHATYVKPDWSAERQKVARIGRHVFYR